MDAWMGLQKAVSSYARPIYKLGMPISQYFGMQEIMPKNASNILSLKFKLHMQVIFENTVLLL